MDYITVKIYTHDHYWRAADFYNITSTMLNLIRIH